MGQPWLDVTLFYPGQVSWPMLVNRNKHPGADRIARGVPVKGHHSELQLSNYGVEMEFKSEIKRQWLLTIFAFLALIVGFGVAINMLTQREEG